MKYKAVLFDMDGTILDTLTDIAAATNAALAASGFPARTVEEVRRMVGNGNHLLCERAVPAGTSPKDIETVFAAFHAYYKLHSADTSRPYDGILPLLETLKADGVRLAVISNKADYAVKDLAEAYFPGLFEVAAGDLAGRRRKPAPDAVLAAMEQLGVTAAEAVYVGDSEVDVETARNAHLRSIAVTWGFRDKETLKAAGAKTFAASADELERELRIQNEE